MEKPPKKSVVLTVTDAYNLWSESYDTYDNPMLAMVVEAFERDPLLVRNCFVVELGCGTGRNVERIRTGGASGYIGLDQSHGMLEKAQRRATYESFLQADIQRQLPIDGGSIDVVLATLVFEHLADLNTTLREAFRILKPNGQLRILEIHPDLSLNGTKAHFEANGKEVSFPCYVHKTEAWKEALDAVGFRGLSFSHLAVDEHLIRKCAKLSKHQGRNALLDIRARKLK